MKQEKFTLGLIFIFNLKIFFFLIFLSLISIVAYTQTLSIEVSGDKSDIHTCEELKYTLKYSCAAGTGNCTNVTMTVSALSGGIIFPSQNVGLTGDIESYNFSGDRRSVTFIFKEPLVAGNTGIITITGQGECGLSEGTIATLTGSIQSGSGTPVTASVNTTLHSENKFCPVKRSGYGLALDNPTIYDIILAPAGSYTSQGLGTTNLTNVVMVDNLPANTVINSVSARYTTGGSFIALPSGTCVIDNTPAAPKVTCTFPDYAFTQLNRYGTWPEVTISATYPDTYFNAGDNVTNSVTVNYTPLGGSPQVATEGSVVTYRSNPVYSAGLSTTSCTADLDVTNTLSAPNPRVDAYKRSVSATIRPGEIIEYQLDIHNTGNVPLTNVVMEDSIPAELKVTSIVSSSTYTGFAGSPTTTTYWIKTVANPTYTQVPSLSVQGTTYTVPSGTEITHIKVEVNNMPPNARIQYIRVNVQLKDGVTSGTVIRNCVKITSTQNPTESDPNNNCGNLTAQPLDNFSTLQVIKALGSYAGGLSASFYAVAQNVGTTAWNNIEVVNL